MSVSRNQGVLTKLMGGLLLAMLLPGGAASAAEYPPLQGSERSAEPSPGWQGEYPPIGGADQRANPWQTGSQQRENPAPATDSNPWRGDYPGANPVKRPQTQPGRPAGPRPYGYGVNPRPPAPPSGNDGYRGYPPPPPANWPGAGYGPGYGDYGVPGGFGDVYPWSEPFNSWGTPGWGWPGSFTIR